MRLRDQDLWQVDEDVKAIATNASIIDLLTQLYGRQAIPFQTLTFPVGTEQRLHTDMMHFNSFPERFMCGVWVALEDVHPDAGPLVYYPGSHKLPSYTNEHRGVYPVHGDRYTNFKTFWKFWEKLVQVHNLEPVEFCPTQGQALIWTANLLHGGTTLRDQQRTRWSQVTHYYFEDCAYYCPFMSEPLLGLIDYREAVDIRTGALIPQTVNGVTLTPEMRQRLKDEALYRLQGKPFIPIDFDEAFYLTLNPDVKAANLDAKDHYLTYGFKEGRRYNL